MAARFIIGAGAIVASTVGTAAALIGYVIGLLLQQVYR